MASFSPIVAGLRRAYAADGGVTIDLDGLELSNTQTCLDFFGVPETCPAVDSATDTFAIPLSGFFGAADYYAIHVKVDGPILDGADCVPPPTPTSPGPCRESGEASYDGSVAPGSWVKFAPSDPAGYVTVAPTFEADGGGGVEFALVRWPDAVYSGILVNDTPSLPVPTGFYDNYYTMALFTPGQLPASIDVEITHTNYLMRSKGSLHVGVLAYNEREDEEPVAGGQVMYVGAA